jgi:hypothetical protein
MRRLVILAAALAVVGLGTFGYLLLDDTPNSVVGVAECPPADQLPSAQFTVEAEATFTPAPSPTPEPAPPTEQPVQTAVPGVSEGLLALQQSMERAIAEYPIKGLYAVAVTDLETGETVGVNADRQQLSGCSINLFVLRQVVLDLNAGTLDLPRVDGLVASTTWSSNAATARDLYAVLGDGDVRAGVARVRDLIGTLDLESTVLDHPPLYPELSVGDGRDNLLTANDANAALLSFWRDEAVAPQWSDYFWKNLATVKPGLNYLLGIVPDANVSHKNGFFQTGDGYVDNDVGIAHWTQGGRQVGFAFSFLSQDIVVKYSDITLGQRLVQLADQYFQSKYAD